MVVPESVKTPMCLNLKLSCSFVKLGRIVVSASLRYEDN